MKFWVTIESHEKQVDITDKDGFFELCIDGKRLRVDARNVGHRDYLSLLIDNKSHLIESAPINFEDGTYYATVNGHRFNVDVFDERLRVSRRASASVKESPIYTVTSPMPGLIVDVRVKVGDTVESGAAVVVIEAMKMQNELVSQVNGVVRAVNIKTTDTVDSQAPLIEIERADERP